MTLRFQSRMWDFIAFVGLLVGFFPCFGFAKPNFVVIVADDMGYSDAGCYGGDISTPNLDKLAANGLRFTQFYSTGRCWPSRTCILTGYYAQEVKMDPPGGPLPAWAHLLPQFLKPLGYRSYHSGKWHVMAAPMPCKDGGFNRSYILEDHDRHFSPRKHRLDDQPLPPVKPDSGYYTTTAIAGYAVDFLKEHAQKHASDPFFLYLAFTCPHFPLQAPAGDIAKYAGKFDEGWDTMRLKKYQRMREMGLIDCALSPLDPKTIPSWNLPEATLKKDIGAGEIGYALPWDSLTAEQKKFQATKMMIHAAMVDRMDQEIGRVLEQLRAMSAVDNTVIIFVSDNGASAEQIIRGDKNDASAPAGSAKTFLGLGPGWSTCSNTPFRLHKSWVHEGGISSPLIVQWPAGISARGELRKSPGHFVDLLPTLVELAGGDASKSFKGNIPPLAGKSLVSAFTKDNSVLHDFLYFHHMDNRALRIGDWKIVSLGKDDPWELYDLSKDRCEMNNLAKSNPDKVQEMSKQWDQHEGDFRKLAGPLEKRQRGKQAVE